MPKFRKKPVVIEAMQLPETVCDLRTIVPIAVWLGAGGPWRLTDDSAIEIDTLEGTMRASPGDWIIRGVEGEIYPCKPGIFAATYEVVP